MPFGFVPCMEYLPLISTGATVDAAGWFGAGEVDGVGVPDDVGDAYASRH